MLDITHENLYIKSLIKVIQSERINCTRTLYIDKRHSDAFVYILSGKCLYTFEDTAFYAKQGDLLYLADSSAYSMKEHSERFSFIYCDFEFNSEKKRKSAVYSFKNSLEIENLFYKLLNTYTNSFTECIRTLYKIYGLILKSAENRYNGSGIKAKIFEAKKYIDSNFSDTDLSVAFLSDMLKISEVYFRRHFKEIFGISPSEYITYTRINNSKELLKYPFLSIEECALQSGFNSLQYFCRVFKNSTGITPAVYRNRKELPQNAAAPLGWTQNSADWTN